MAGPRAKFGTLPYCSAAYRLGVASPRILAVVINQRPSQCVRFTGAVRVAAVLAAVVVAAGLCAGFPSPARAEPFEVPPLTSPASNAHLTGKLVWLDLETTDLPGAKRFYRALFGWDFRNYHAYRVDYAVALINGTPVAGLLRRPIVRDTERRSLWLPFFSVPDVTVAFEEAQKTHAGVRSGPQTLPQRGREARLSDPEGAIFALLASSSGDPPDDPNPRAIGSWGSPSLLARDPAAEAVFYQGLLHYAVLGAPGEAGFERIRLSSGPQARAEVRELPGGDATLQPQWVSFVRVFSAAETAQQAVRLGGRIVVATTRSSHDATVAILADPTGAVFGVMELPPEVARLPFH
jgi:predicted enzyme related to lactoylglutathione lyase